MPRSKDSDPIATLADVVLWQIDDDGVAHEVTAPPLMDTALYDVGEAYFEPPPTEGATWPPGRYVFEIKPAAGQRSRWMALEFVTTRA